MIILNETRDKMISPPTNCPSCNSTLVWQKDTLYCKNLECTASGQKRVEHFAKTLKIKGLGPAAIEKLDLNSVEEIYQVDIAYLTVCLNSAVLALKLLNEIKNSTNQPLNLVLPGFGISLIGKTATDKLSQVCESIFDIDEDTCKAAGLGEKATNNLLTWMDNSFDKYCDLPFSFEFEKTQKLEQEAKGVVCISGKLNSFKTKAEAANILAALGYKVKDTLTKDVTILVNESGKETEKTLKARESGITIVNNLKDFIGE
jgi:DNA ligase (NAD+)